MTSVTIPCAALVGAGMELVTRAPGGVAIAIASTGALALLAFVATTRKSGSQRLTVPAQPSREPLRAPAEPVKPSEASSMAGAS